MTEAKKKKKEIRKRVTIIKVYCIQLWHLPTDEKTGWLPPQNMPQGSKALYDNIPDTFIAVNSLAMNTTINSGNDSSPFPY